jgi:hypothetical protein
MRTFEHLYHTVLFLQWEMSDKGCTKHTFYVHWIVSENRAVYGIIKQKRDTSQMTIWRIRIARWTPKAINTHPEYVMLIVFPLWHWLRERASVTLYVYCRVLLSTGMVVVFWEVARCSMVSGRVSLETYPAYAGSGWNMPLTKLHGFTHPVDRFDIVVT